jgi:hypothetical protein
VAPHSIWPKVWDIYLCARATQAPLRDIMGRTGGTLWAMAMGDAGYKILMWHGLADDLIFPEGFDYGR